MTKFFNKLKKPCFWPIFPILGALKFSWKIRLSRTTSHEILAPCQNLEKITDTIPRKSPDRRKDGQNDRRTDGLSSGYRRGSKKIAKHQVV